MENNIRESEGKTFSWNYEKFLTNAGFYALLVSANDYALSALWKRFTRNGWSHIIRCAILFFLIPVKTFLWMAIFFRFGPLKCCISDLSPSLKLLSSILFLLKLRGNYYSNDKLCYLLHVFAPSCWNFGCWFHYCNAMPVALISWSFLLSFARRFTSSLTICWVGHPRAFVPWTT